MMVIVTPAMLIRKKILTAATSNVISVATIRLLQHAQKLPVAIRAVRQLLHGLLTPIDVVQHLRLSGTVVMALPKPRAQQAHVPPAAAQNPQGEFAAPVQLGDFR